RLRDAVAVKPATPSQVSDTVVLLGPLCFEQRLGLAVPLLLFPIGFHDIAPVVPDKSPRVKANRAACLLHAPAQINVVARDPENGITAANLLQDVVPERHVAARNMFCHAVGKKNVDWATWCVGNAVSNQPVIGRGDIGTADTCETVLLKRVCEVLK